MDTNSARAAAAAVIGARHLRLARNGQDAAASWIGDDCGAIVVCDGCSAGASSEVGARLGAQLVIAALADQLSAGERPPLVWTAVRAQLVAELERLVRAMQGDACEPVCVADAPHADAPVRSAKAPDADAYQPVGIAGQEPRSHTDRSVSRDAASARRREVIVHDHFLFTIVAAAWRGDEVAVWALGDGAYALGDRVVELGPFAENQPPYVGYDLLGAPQPAHVDVADALCGSVIVATDGAAELGGLAAFAHDRFLGHPDALRRHLAIAARNVERVDWEARRIDRRAAALQDDGAVAVLRWGRSSAC